MIKIIKPISIDVAKENIFKPIVAKQTDYDSRFLKVRLTNEGEQIDIKPTSVVAINARRENDEAKAFLGEVNEDGTVTVPITNWMLEMNGQLKCDISVINTEQRKLSTTAFTISVEAAAYDGDISEDEKYDILVNLIAEVKSLEEELEVKLANGEFKGEKGDKGDAGSIKFIVVDELPTEDIDESAIYMKLSDIPEEKNIFKEYIYVDGAWECIGSTSVGADLTDYVKNTDYATQSTAGVVKGSTRYGALIGAGGIISIQKATEDEINSRNQEHKPIVPANLEYAVKSVTYDKAEIDTKLGEVVNTVLETLTDVSEVGQ